ncbi:AAA family ATPase [Vibrio caribbeanicus]|uniref:AAA family ATPase n=1 Tax=Vibrio caribbeanicus TaxID=701175 RepID=UPI002284B04D|nr:AAA family ATPase [Vibrio caribbeanicus]MCY9845822.1 AAA family ATPase [Vibrio caribbeanicus]
MSVAHDPRVLEFKTQTELLGRLQLLTNFGSNLVTVGGEKGAGKTWLVHYYLEAWAQDKNQALLMCYPNQDDSQRRSTILNQLISEPSYSPTDSLVESFTRNMQGEHCDIVIAIDDAHLLSESFVTELWMLVIEAQANPSWTINVLLFAQANALDALLTRLGYGQDQKPIDLEIESFTQDEADLFFEQLVIRFVDDDMEKRVRNAYRNVELRPGEIMALGEQKVEKRIIIRSIVGSPINIALLSLTLLVLIGGGYWWLMLQPSAEEQAQQVSESMEQTVIPTLADQAQQKVEEAVESELEDSMLDQGSVETDDIALPPEVAEVNSHVGNQEEEHQRVIISSDVVDALMESPSQSDSQDETMLRDQTIGTGPQTSEQTVTPDQPNISFSFTKEELNSFSPRSYTLQLAAVRSLQEVQVFLDKHSLSNQVFIYPTNRNNNEWYIITYQNYPTIQVARDAVRSLPADVQNLDPWAKSLGQVQREIRNTLNR